MCSPFFRIPFLPFFRSSSSPPLFFFDSFPSSSFRLFLRPVAWPSLPCPPLWWLLSWPWWPPPPLWWPAPSSPSPWWPLPSSCLLLLTFPSISPPAPSWDKSDHLEPNKAHDTAIQEDQVQNKLILLFPNMLLLLNFFFLVLFKLPLTSKLTVEEWVKRWTKIVKFLLSQCVVHTAVFLTSL